MSNHWQGQHRVLVQSPKKLNILACLFSFSLMVGTSIRDKTYYKSMSSIIDRRLHEKMAGVTP